MASPLPEFPVPDRDPARPGGSGRTRPRTGLVAAAMVLFWPVGLAALFAAARATRAEGAGLTGAARAETHSAHRRSWTAVIVGGSLVALRITMWSVLAVQLAGHGPGLLDRMVDGGNPAPVRQAGAVPGPWIVSPRDLATGDCFRAPHDDSAWAELDEIELIPCAEEHDVVVIGVHQHGETSWPGDEAVADAAWATCSAAYWEYMGRDAPEYADLWPWMPTEYGWQDGDRASPCLLVASEPVRGSLRDRPGLVELDPQTESA